MKKTKCKGCKYLHIGINVDHNHCNKSNVVWMQKRANGMYKGGCIYYSNFEGRTKTE